MKHTNTENSIDDPMNTEDQFMKHTNTAHHLMIPGIQRISHDA
jgi:hypothetical protein